MAQDDPLADAVRRVSDDLDRWQANRSLGRPSPLRSDEQIDQVVAAAEQLLNAARGPGRPVNPPRWVSADGSKAGW